MNNKVKEFFNYMSRKWHKKHRSIRPRQGRYLGYRPTHYVNIPPMDKFTHFIDCELSPAICPMKWEDLEIQFDLLEKRYCEYCGKYVYRVDNQYMLDQMQEKNRCIAISSNFLEKLNGQLNNEEHKRLEDKLLFSKLFLIHRYIHPSEHKKYLEENLTQEQILKNVILSILESKNIEDNIKMYSDRDVELQRVFEILVDYIEDKVFIENMIEKMHLAMNQKTMHN